MKPALVLQHYPPRRTSGIEPMKDIRGRTYSIHIRDLMPLQAFFDSDQTSVPRKAYVGQFNNSQHYSITTTAPEMTRMVLTSRTQKHRSRKKESPLSRCASPLPSVFDAASRLFSSSSGQNTIILRDVWRRTLVPP